MTTTKRQRTYVQVVIDESGSMDSIRRDTVKALNGYIQAIKDSTKDQEVFVRVTTFGGPYSGPTKEILRLSPVSALTEIKEDAYHPTGGTPLFDAVGEAFTYLEGLPDAKDADVSFLLLTVTDGGENQSVNFTGQKIQRKIEELQKTDRWTFAFLVPPGGARQLSYLGVHQGNVKEWEATRQGVERQTVATQTAIGSYFTSRSAGVRASQTFYTDLSKVTKADLKQLDDVTNEIELWEVKEDTAVVRPFVESKLKGKPMLKGSAFYQLMKTEKKVQDDKKLMLVEKKTKKVLFGDKVRSFLGLPDTGTVKVEPGNHGDFDVFVQSKSVNRKLPRGTKVIYYEKIGVPFTEGPSAR